MVRPLNDLDRLFPELAQRLAKLAAGIAAISEDVSQQGMAADDFGEGERCTIAVLHVNGVNVSMNHISVSGGHDVPLSALDFPACSVTAGPTTLGGFDASAIIDNGAGTGFAPHGSPADQMQGVIGPNPKTTITPPVEPA